MISMDLQNDLTVEERLCVQAIGWDFLRCAKRYDIHDLARQVDSAAVSLIKEIQGILDDLTLDDPECFLRIDAIVRTFHKYDLPTSRHWEVE